MDSAYDPRAQAWTKDSLSELQQMSLMRMAGEAKVDIRLRYY